MAVDIPTLSRIEEILKAGLNDQSYNEPPLSRVEYLLIELIKLIETGSVDGIVFHEWESGRGYKVGDYVLYDKNFYECLETNTDATFDPNKWDEISGGGDEPSYPDWQANHHYIPGDTVSIGGVQIAGTSVDYPAKTLAYCVVENSDASFNKDKWLLTVQASGLAYGLVKDDDAVAAFLSNNPIATVKSYFTTDLKFIFTADEGHIWINVGTDFVCASPKAITKQQIDDLFN